MHKMSIFKTRCASSNAMMLGTSAAGTTLSDIYPKVNYSPRWSSLITILPKPVAGLLLQGFFGNIIMGNPCNSVLMMLHVLN